MDKFCKGDLANCELSICELGQKQKDTPFLNHVHFIP